ncbi:MAG: hypothetical protein I8H70_00395 [Burkholderiales bacterium]|nr:hypothetical protein [Burkholderiales bacterium]
MSGALEALAAALASAHQYCQKIRCSSLLSAVWINATSVSNLDSSLAAVPLHGFASISLQRYVAASTPPSQDTLRMVGLLAGLLHQMMENRPTARRE